MGAASRPRGPRPRPRRSRGPPAPRPARRTPPRHRAGSRPCRAGTGPGRPYRAGPYLAAPCLAVPGRAWPGLASRTWLAVPSRTWPGPTSPVAPAPRHTRPRGTARGAEGWASARGRWPATAAPPAHRAAPDSAWEALRRPRGPRTNPAQMAIPPVGRRDTRPETGEGRYPGRRCPGRPGRLRPAGVAGRTAPAPAPWPGSGDGGRTGRKQAGSRRRLGTAGPQSREPGRDLAAGPARASWRPPGRGPGGYHSAGPARDPWPRPGGDLASPALGPWPPRAEGR